MTCRPRTELGDSCVGVRTGDEPCALSSDGLTECTMGACTVCEWVQD